MRGELEKQFLRARRGTGQYTISRTETWKQEYVLGCKLVVTIERPHFRRRITKVDFSYDALRSVPEVWRDPFYHFMYHDRTVGTLHANRENRTERGGDAYRRFMNMQKEEWRDVTLTFSNEWMYGQAEFRDDRAKIRVCSRPSVVMEPVLEWISDSARAIPIEDLAATMNLDPRKS